MCREKKGGFGTDKTESTRMLEDVPMPRTGAHRAVHLSSLVRRGSKCHCVHHCWPAVLLQTWPPDPRPQLFLSRQVDRSPSASGVAVRIGTLALNVCSCHHTHVQFSRPCLPGAAFPAEPDPVFHPPRLSQAPGSVPSLAVFSSSFVLPLPAAGGSLLPRGLAHPLLGLSGSPL